MPYTHFEVKKMLSSIIILYDTREQETDALKKRLEGFKCSSERYKLSFGDYSIAYIDLSGEKVYMDNKVSVERKMSLDELCTCFTDGRDRFEREFLRAKEIGAKIHLLVEEASYEKIFNGSYKSKLNSDALIASCLAWSNRYDILLHFCHRETTPRLIYKILYYFLKDYLEKC